ncbi:MAG TPA: DNA alkylation repair protein [Polyangia bacterium]|nr:DNA alkylation repair protein [Polyangia bacterium]
MPDRAPRTADVRQALADVARPKDAAALRWFFKTGPGEYGEGDVFIGVRVPAQRRIARRFRALPLRDAVKLLASKTHEHRLTALLILVDQYRRGDEQARARIVAAYRASARFVNNWDLVDASAPAILGDWLRHGDRTQARRQLLDLARAPSVWQRRIAMLATHAFIRAGEAEEALAVARTLLADSHDLIHKAVGWMLRGVGRRVGLEPLRQFLRTNAAHMSRTTLRYAIERLPPAERARWLTAGRSSEPGASSVRASRVG